MHVLNLANAYLIIKDYSKNKQFDVHEKFGYLWCSIAILVLQKFRPKASRSNSIVISFLNQVCMYMHNHFLSMLCFHDNSVYPQMTPRQLCHMYFYWRDKLNWILKAKETNLPWKDSWHCASGFLLFDFGLLKMTSMSYLSRPFYHVFDCDL